MESHVVARLVMAALLAAWLCIVICRSRVVFITSGAVALALLGTNYHSREWLEQPFEVHYFFGIALTFSARQVLCSDGLPATAHWLPSFIITLTSMAIFYGDWTHTTYLAHLILDSSAAIIGAMSMVQALLSTRAPSKAALVQRVRQLTDPACIAAVGFVFLKHIHHGTHPMPGGMLSIANLYHSSIAHSMLTLAATSVGSSLVHAAMGYERRHHELCVLMRRVTAFAWVYPGLVLIHMACVLHVEWFPGGGSLHDHWAAVNLFAANEEAMSLYLAQFVLFDALLVSILMLTAPAAEADGVGAAMGCGPDAGGRVAPLEAPEEKDSLLP